MKKASILISILSALVLCGCFETEQDIPNGYTLICSDDGSRYGFVDDDGWMYQEVYLTKSEAIKGAIRWYGWLEKYKPEPNPKDLYTWHSCP